MEIILTIQLKNASIAVNLYFQAQNMVYGLTMWSYMNPAKVIFLE